MTTLDFLLKVFPSVRALLEDRNKWHREYQEARNDVADLVETLDKERSIRAGHQCTPKTIFATLFKEGVPWYDFAELPHGEQVAYYKDAQQALQNRSISNIHNMLIALCTQEAFLNDKTGQQIRDMQMTVNGVELLLTYLRDVPDPSVEETVLDPHADI